jgi:hypothetical protein
MRVSDLPRKSQIIVEQSARSRQVPCLLMAEHVVLLGGMRAKVGVIL